MPKGPKRGRRAQPKAEPKSDAERAIAAQVIVRSASGARVRGDVPITSENVAEYAPAPEEAAAVTAAFRAAGFEVGAVVGISFSITAPLSRFEQYFDTRLRVDDRGAIAPAGGRAPSGGLELPLGALPDEVRERVVAVAFTPPADLMHGEASSSALY